jgi:four helix bundle protein
LNDSEGEACETQVWIEFARQCQYLDDTVCEDLDAVYNHIMGQLVKMISQPEKWLIKNQQKPETGPPSS